MSQFEFDFEIPPELEPGVYANAFTVSHTAYEFTIDFAVVTGPDDSTVQRALGVARVRVPVALLFDVLQALNRSLTDYEEIYGGVQMPRRKRDDENEPRAPGS